MNSHDSFQLRSSRDEAKETILPRQTGTQPCPPRRPPNFCFIAPRKVGIPTPTLFDRPFAIYAPPVHVEKNILTLATSTSFPRTHPLSWHHTFPLPCISFDSPPFPLPSLSLSIPYKNNIKIHRQPPPKLRISALRAENMTSCQGGHLPSPHRQHGPRGRRGRDRGGRGRKGEGRREEGGLRAGACVCKCVCTCVKPEKLCVHLFASDLYLPGSASNLNLKVSISWK